MHPTPLKINNSVDNIYFYLICLTTKACPYISVDEERVSLLNGVHFYFKTMSSFQMNFLNGDKSASQTCDAFASRKQSEAELQQSLKEWERLIKHKIVYIAN
jgi:hypothetical protein